MDKVGTGVSGAVVNIAIPAVTFVISSSTVYLEMHCLTDMFVKLIGQSSEEYDCKRNRFEACNHRRITSPACMQSPLSYLESHILC